MFSWIKNYKMTQYSKGWWSGIIFCIGLEIIRKFDPELWVNASLIAVWIFITVCIDLKLDKENK